jgi:hypothetical protein
MDYMQSVGLNDLEKTARLSKADKLMNDWTAKKCAAFVVNSVIGYAYRLKDRLDRVEKARKAWLESLYRFSLPCYRIDLVLPSIKGNLG